MQMTEKNCFQLGLKGPDSSTHDLANKFRTGRHLQSTVYSLPKNPKTKWTQGACNGLCS